MLQSSRTTTQTRDWRRLAHNMILSGSLALPCGANGIRKALLRKSFPFAPPRASLLEGPPGLLLDARALSGSNPITSPDFIGGASGTLLETCPRYLCGLLTPWQGRLDALSECARVSWPLTMVSRDPVGGIASGDEAFAKQPDDEGDLGDGQGAGEDPLGGGEGFRC